MNSTDALIQSARDSLALARVIIHGPSASRVTRAQRCIARARALWARVRAAIAVGAVDLVHKYQRTPDAWRGMVTTQDGAVLWTSARSYGKRQSAQRAALRERGRMVESAESEYLCGLVAMAY